MGWPGTNRQLATGNVQRACPLACGACWSDEPKIVAYDAWWIQKIEDCKRITNWRTDGLVSLEVAECQSTATLPAFEKIFPYRPSETVWRARE